MKYLTAFISLFALSMGMELFEELREGGSGWWLLAQVACWMLAVFIVARTWPAPKEDIE